MGAGLADLVAAVPLGALLRPRRQQLLAGDDLGAGAVSGRCLAHEGHAGAAQGGLEAAVLGVHVVSPLSMASDSSPSSVSRSVIRCLSSGDVPPEPPPAASSFSWMALMLCSMK
ncbi:hypothetical protein 2209_scaffold441_00019 [Bacteriophage sp.]|nr:hypothetical protein 2209_scaffold441_00019 [Bacteriophage sp.]